MLQVTSRPVEPTQKAQCYPFVTVEYFCRIFNKRILEKKTTLNKYVVYSFPCVHRGIRSQSPFTYES